MMRGLAKWWLWSFAAVLAAQQPAPEAAAPEVVRRTHAWSPATVEALATLPVQEGGRVKPLSAHAAATLHLVHGRRDMKLDTDGDGKDDLTLTPTEWLLDVWFFPEVAAHYPLFRIENVEVLDAIGIPHEGGQRFRLEYVSFAAMAAPGRVGVPGQKLIELAHQYSRKQPLDRSPVESHLVNSAQQVNTYYDLHYQMEVLRSTFPIEGEPLRAALGEVESLDFAALLERLPAFRTLLRENSDKLEDPAWAGAARLGAALQQLSGSDAGAALFPPTGSVGDSEVWLGLGGVLDLGVRGDIAAEKLGMVRHLQRAIVATEQGPRERELVQFRDAVVARATARGEYAKVELENTYLTKSWHYQALHWFLLAIVVVGVGWLAPRKRWLWALGLVATAIPLGMLTWDIVLRCLIRERPPIVNLHDTFLFIAAVGVAAAIVGEVIVRRRFVIALAPIFGALLIALARAFEVEDGKDQLAPLIAVLDTNYYLATHVTSINMGYAAGMFGALVGTLWLLLQAFGIARHDQAFHKAVVRACYGIVAFGLIFAVFGTIYGGVWANDSWGRFWGWDPKENGALLICIAQVALLHARWCGWVKDLGFCVGAALTGIVVAFSWFHVNLLGIGLHSYGFASSTKSALFWYYGIQLALVAVGWFGTVMRRVGAAAAVPAAVPAGD
ncbi:MAG: cytochrome c biogenesis protein CcsA [Planctomycetes bacterium]|nr:cytochrome c biogenesis protein CcsA [Planctomycetota bacterium]